MGKPRYHQSRLVQFDLCGHAFYLAEVEGRHGGSTFYGARGTGVHAGRQANLTQKVGSGVDADMDVCLDAVRDSCNSVDDLILQADEIVGLNKYAAKSVLIDTAISLARVDRQRLQPLIQPVQVEIKLAIALPNYPFDLAMRLDSIDNDDCITDLKHSKRKWNQDQADTAYQPPVYTLAGKAHIGRPLKFRYQIVTLTGGGKLSAYTIPTEVSEARIRAVLERFTAMHKSIEAGIFTPAHAGHWKCSPKFCEFWNECKYAKR